MRRKTLGLLATMAIMIAPAGIRAQDRALPDHPSLLYLVASTKHPESPAERAEVFALLRRGLRRIPPRASVRSP